MFRKMTLTLALATAACAVAAPAALAGNKAYIAYGDSYASGPGQNDAAGSCLRSATKNYPALVAAHYGLGASGTGNWADYSCQGATTATVASQISQSLVVPSGGSAPLGPDTKAVTINVGGDDQWRAPVAGVTNTTSPWDAIANCSKFGPDCTDTSVNPGLVQQADITATKYQNWIQPLVQTIEDQTWSPTAHTHARIILVSYPAVLPPTYVSTCRDSNFSKWGFTSQAEFTYITGLLTKLLSVQQATKTALVALGADVVVADTYNPSLAGVGHSLCQLDASQRWINTPIWSFTGFTAASGHPTDIGMQNFASIVETASGL
jgi:hypothetical protein